VFTSGNPKFFSNGLDASNVSSVPDEKLAEEVGEIRSFFNHLLRFDKPVIAEVTGWCMGGGAVITVGSDYKYMLEGKARISFSEVLVGLPLPGNFIDKIARTVYPPFVNSVRCRELQPARPRRLALSTKRQLISNRCATDAQEARLSEPHTPVGAATNQAGNQCTNFGTL
jgi:hypothetical protein